MELNAILDYPKERYERDNEIKNLMGEAVMDYLPWQMNW